MKILLINDNHHVTGGAESYFFELKSKLKQTPGIDVFSIGFGEKKCEGDDYAIFKSLKSNAAKLAGRLIPHPVLLRQLKKRIATFQPDVIHLHNVKQYTATVLKAIKPYPVVQTVHDFSLICPTSQNIHRDLSPCDTGLRKQCFWQHQVKFNWIEYLLISATWLVTRRQLKNSVDCFTAPSPFLANYLEANQFTPVHYIPPFRNILSDPAFNKIQPYRFLFAGSLASHKGVMHLLDEFELARQQNPLLTLDIAGFGPLENALQNKEGVRLLGWQNNLASYYQQSVALIFPSIGLESFGLVVSEAMSHGRPVIGVNRGTTAWLVEDGKTGLLFDPLEKGDLAEKMLSLAGNTEYAMQLGSQGQKRISELIANEAVLEKMIGVYKTL